MNLIPLRKTLVRHLSEKQAQPEIIDGCFHGAGGLFGLLLGRRSALAIDQPPIRPAAIAPKMTNASEVENFQARNFRSRAPAFGTLMTSAANKRTAPRTSLRFI